MPTTWMAGAMVWMVAAMPVLMAGTGPHAGADGMSGMDGDARMSDLSATSGGAATFWGVAVTVAFVIVLVALAGWWSGRVVRVGRPRIDAGCHVCMCLSMAGMLVAMN